jgi:predicted  nucleic acid-binding Zn-ribbon protein
MEMELEKEIRDLQKELTEVKKQQNLLRLKPCQGDSEIQKKEEELDELEKRIRIIKENIYGLERKRHSLISESTIKEASESSIS